MFVFFSNNNADALVFMGCQLLKHVLLLVLLIGVKGTDP